MLAPWLMEEKYPVRSTGYCLHSGGGGGGGAPSEVISARVVVGAGVGTSGSPSKQLAGLAKNTICCPKEFAGVLAKYLFPPLANAPH